MRSNGSQVSELDSDGVRSKTKIRVVCQWKSSFVTAVMMEDMRQEGRESERVGLRASHETRSSRVSQSLKVGRYVL